VEDEAPLAFGGQRTLRPAPVDVAAVVGRLDHGSAEEALVVEVDPEALDETLALLTEDGGATVTARADGDAVELRVTRFRRRDPQTARSSRSLWKTTRSASRPSTASFARAAARST
jgi:hypothetical protein